ncbi:MULTISPECIES: amidohydrolase [Kordiimonas]|uniref:amidohydrolase n=1 Tax=Kordiimonas TaxID=288021 RepID=UPI00257C1B50|nr:amidohydrolase [Kordiimonas sp. UBA4487]
MKIHPEAKKQEAKYTAIRRHIHAHPELGFEEVRTSELVADELMALGLDVVRGIGKTGVVGSLKRGTSDRAIMLRADMDALPIQEANSFEHRSKTDGCFHGCGHDGHTATLLAGADLIANHTDFDGTVHFVFQPAEEGLGGAMAMIDDGLFGRFDASAVYAMHNWPLMPLGQFATRSGPFLASSDTFDIRVQGKGGHAAFPELCKNPLLAATAFVTAATETFGLDTENALLTFTSLKVGGANNVIADTARILGGVRCFDEEMRHQIEEGLKHNGTFCGDRFGQAIDVHYNRMFPVLENTASETELACKAARQVVGSALVNSHFDRVRGSEDFAFMLKHKPGCYILLGGGQGADAPMCHHPEYDFNDEMIAIGASYWAALVGLCLST